MEQTQRPQPLAFLLIRRGPGSGQIHTITREQTTIGRLKKNTIVIVDPEVSRRHACISLVGGQFLLEDLGSTNGTTLNDALIAGAVPLHHGDTITLGSGIVLSFQCEMPQQEGRPAKVVRYLPVLLPVLAVVLTAALIAAAVSLQPQPSRTTAVLLAPIPGETLNVNRRMTVVAAAFPDLPVTRLELWVDGALLAQQTNLEGETAPVYLRSPLLFSAAGQHAVIARVFDASGSRSQARLEVSVQGVTDRDGDLIPDGLDSCPDTAGSSSAGGCPDADFDTVADYLDACPLEAGALPAAGCPIPTANDADGDGLPDSADTCPDVPGTQPASGCPDSDGDSTADEADECPQQPGPAAAAGCPAESDMDGDLVADAVDLCPARAGEADLQGCQDTDGDGTTDEYDACPLQPGTDAAEGCPDADGDNAADSVDLCPTTAGALESYGCPLQDTAADPIDSDADGLPDRYDLCPQDEGEPDLAGCLPPGAAADADNNGIADDWQLLSSMPLSGVLASWLVNPPEDLEVLEFEPVLLQAPEKSGPITCEVWSNGDFPAAYRFSPGTDAPAESSAAGLYQQTRALASPGFTLFSTGRQAALKIECFASTQDGLVSLGVIERTTYPSEWNGLPIQSLSSPENGEEPFILEYRLCEKGCTSAEGTPLPPVAELLQAGSRHWMLWEYMPGQPVPDYHNLYLNGALVWSIPAGVQGLQLDFLPPCSQQWNLTLTSVVDGMESLPGRPLLLEGETCMQQVLVRFTDIELQDLLPADEPGAGVGPLRGTFFAFSGTGLHQLSWSAAWSNEDQVGAQNCTADGLRLLPGSTDTTWLFSWIGGSGESGEAADSALRQSGQLYAPALPDLLIGLDPGQPLTLGAVIEDIDCPGRHNDILLEVSRTIDPAAGGSLELSGSHAAVTVEIELLPGP